tara:strand:- start:95 stop:529 length:435 start_codon:yes stop_codon:yes gene_type:complete
MKKLFLLIGLVVFLTPMVVSADVILTCPSNQVFKIDLKNEIIYEDISGKNTEKYQWVKLYGDYNLVKDESMPEGYKLVPNKKEKIFRKNFIVFARIAKGTKTSQYNKINRFTYQWYDMASFIDSSTDAEGYYTYKEWVCVEKKI